MMLQPKFEAFPFHVWRLALAILTWNALILLDRHWLGFSVLGPFGLLACLGLTAVAFTAPATAWPGTWLVRRPDFARRWWWVFWLWGVGGLLGGFLAADDTLARLLGSEPLVP